MKIAVISTMNVAPWGGSEALWADTVEAGIKAGHEMMVSVINWKNRPSRIDELERAGAKFFFRPAPQTVNGILSKAINYSKQRYSNPFASVFKQTPDCTLVSQGGTFDLANESALLKSLLQQQSPWFLLSQYNDETGVLDEQRLNSARNYFTKAQKVCFVANRNWHTAERQLAQRITNGILVKNPLNLCDRTYVQWPAPSSAVEIACVARLDCNFKGQDILLEALSRPEWKQRQWKLNFYGSGADRSYLEKLAHHYEVSDKVFFHGHQPDIRSIWKTNQLLVLPSIGEGTPLALTEAMLCGRCAVVTDVGGNAEWVNDGVNGFIATAPAATHIAAAMERAWSSMPEWKQMGVAARETALQKTDPDPGHTMLSIITGKAR